MGRIKTLAENTFIFAICNFTSKLLVFFMLPFYTTVLSKEEFGTADLLTTIVGLLYPVLTLSIANGSMRYALDKNVDPKKAFSIGFYISGIGACLLLFSWPLLSRISFIGQYIIVFLALYVSTVFQNFLSLFARGIQKVRLVGIAGVISSFTVVGCNILFLFFFHFGVRGYVWSIVISNLAAIAILFFGAKMYKLFSISKDRELTKEMLLYSLPLMPNSLSWWINHSANRLILNSYCGVADVGIYSAASKMPSIIDTFRGIFIQAWQLSTITEYDKSDANSFFEGMYRVYHVFIILLTGLLIVLSKVIGSVLYSKDFAEAWEITPLLFYGILFGSLIAYYSPTYLAQKKTKILFLSTFCGAIITIALNLVLIPYFGIIGTAITSVFSNFAIYLFLHIDSKKYLGFSINNTPYYCSYLILALLVILITFIHVPPIGWISTLLMVIIVVVLRKDLLLLIRMGKSLIKRT